MEVSDIGRSSHSSQTDTTRLVETKKWKHRGNIVET